MRLYPPVAVKRQSFKGEKILTIPSQSMSLHEIVRRFVRREALPLMKEGTYETRMGDLEKLSREDITVQMERVQELKSNIKHAEKRMEDEHKRKIDEEIKRQAAESLQQKTQNNGGASGTSEPTPTP